jgi:hypothetical protein
VNERFTQKIALLGASRDAYALLKALETRGYEVRLLSPGMDDSNAADIVSDSQMVVCIGLALASFGKKTIEALVQLKRSGRHSVFLPEPPTSISSCIVTREKMLSE